MKKVKHYLLAFLFLTTMFACENNSDLIIKNKEITMFKGDSVKIEVANVNNHSDLIVTSLDEIVAKNKGLMIYGGLIGKTVIKISDGHSETECIVEVKPRYSLKKDPEFDFGTSLNKVKENGPLGTFDTDILYYNDYSSYYGTTDNIYYSYSFINDSLNTFYMTWTVQDSEFSNFEEKYLEERYLPLRYTTDIYVLSAYKDRNNRFYVTRQLRDNKLTHMYIQLEKGTYPYDEANN